MLLQFTTICFVLITITVFALSPGKLRRYVLLLSSLIYIGIEGGCAGLVTVLFITLLTWGAGVCFFSRGDNPNISRDMRKPATVFMVILLSGILFGWKYLPWAALQLGANVNGSVLGIAIPIGLSFYTFQAISYVLDLHGGRILPEKSFIDFAIYMTWFPKWMSGPIERASAFTSQLKFQGNIRIFSFKRITWAASYFVWGLVMKLMVADKVAIAVDAAYSEIPSMGSAALIITAFLYSIQIYCDFAGYTNVAIGISKLFGLDLTQNFKTPYMAENITDFWRRWHITLSSFLRDYIYIPLGGNRKGSLRKHLNTIVVFLICGMWHGAGLSFIVWGLIHACLSIITALVKKTGLAFLTRGKTGRALTFLFVTFAWIFFRADSLTIAAGFIRGMIPGLSGNGLFAGLSAEDGLVLGLSVMDWCIAVISIIVIAVFDAFAFAKDSIPPMIMNEKISDTRRIVLLSVILSLVLVFGEYGAGDEIRKFVYMNF